jgi:hypothetical protein
MQIADTTASRIRIGLASALARFTAAILLFELLSGLAVTFGPFHPAIEWGLLLHTVIGFAALAPLAWYFVTHWQDHGHQALSDVTFLGYAGVVTLFVCAASGLAVTWQGLLGTHTTAPYAMSTSLQRCSRWRHRSLTWCWRGCAGEARSPRAKPPHGSLARPPVVLSERS